MVKINGQKLADLGFYINLDKRVDRKEQILKNLENFIKHDFYCQEMYATLFLLFPIHRETALPWK